MFENIGGKIKVVAKVECWLGIFSSISIGVNLISTEEEFLVFTGILVMIVGAITAWLGSFLIYGFGQLVENSDILTGRAVKKDETVRNVQIVQEEEMSDEDKINELNILLDKGLISYPNYLKILNELEEDGE